MGLLSTAVPMAEAAVSSMGAVVLSNPFEVVKTRLQLQGELQRSTAANTHYRGTLHGFVTIARNEGVSALYKGFGAALAYQGVLNATRIGLFDDCKAAVRYAVPGGLVPDGVATSVVAGMFMGYCSNFVASPLSLVKTRQQAQSSHVAVGEQHQYRNFAHGLRCIAADKGFKGLWQGASFSAIRTAVGSGVQLGSYDGIKVAAQEFTGWGAGESRLHFVSSLGSGALLAFFMNPFDVVMTRVYSASANTHYSGNFAANFAKIAKAEGVRGMWKGTGALFARVGPQTIGTFVLLERIRGLRRDAFPGLAE
jgi:solute carrier family 25 protein 34/35